MTMTKFNRGYLIRETEFVLKTSQKISIISNYTNAIKDRYLQNSVWIQYISNRYYYDGENDSVKIW